MDERLKKLQKSDRPLAQFFIDVAKLSNTLDKSGWEREIEVQYCTIKKEVFFRVYRCRKNKKTSNKVGVSEEIMMMFCDDLKDELWHLKYGTK